MQFQKPIHQKQSTINTDISRENYGSIVAAIQGDGDDRCVHVRLLDNGVEWTPPAQTWAEVRYVKPDGTVGLYDTRTDGRPAVFVRGAEATVYLASQMLTVPGTVKAAIAFVNSRLSRVTTFPFTVTVEKDIFAGAQKSEDFIKLKWLEDQLDEHLKQAKESGMFDGPKGDAFTYEDFTPEQLAALTGPQGPQGDNTAAIEAAAAANAAAKQATDAAAAAQAVVNTVVPDVNQIKSKKADKTALARIDRSLDALWKLNQGITYQFETDDTEAYQKTVPSGAKLASVEKIGGKTVVWNQLIFNSNFDDPQGFKTMDNSTLSIVENKAHIHRDETTGGTASIVVEKNYRSTAISGRMYLLGVTVRTANCMVSLMPTGTSAGGTYPYASYPNATRIRYIWNCKETGAYELEIRGWTGSGVTSAIDFTVEKYFFFDLTSMFGAGNEPTSTDDPRIEWIERYAAEYAEYNAGVLANAGVENVKYNNETISYIPASVRSLPGYGWSAEDACNAIERTDTGWQYVQRVGSREYQEGDTITDGVTTYYVLDNPVITDITDLMDGVMDAITVAIGGTLTFENSAKLPVPSSVEYAVKLSEVNG